MKILKFLEVKIGRTSSKLLRVAYFFLYLRQGIEEGFPICCVLHFSWTAALCKRPAAMLRGKIHIPGTDSIWVPCGIHKGRHPYWNPWEDDEHAQQLKLFNIKPNTNPPKVEELSNVSDSYAV